MHLGVAFERFGALGLNEGNGGLLHLRRDAARQCHGGLTAFLLQPIDEFFAREDGRRRNGIVRLGLGALVELDFTPFFHQRALKHAHIGEFVGKRPGAVGA